MPVEISVGPPVLTINRGSTFMVTNLSGEIEADSEHGVFYKDTRLVSYYSISANGEPWERLSSSATTYYDSRVHLINRKFNTEEGTVAQGTIALTLGRTIANTIVEKLTLYNYSQKDVKFNLEIAIRSDFADIFEVRQRNFFRRGRIVTTWIDEPSELRMEYTNGDFYRLMTYRPLACPSLVHYANGRVTFEIDLKAGQNWETEAVYSLCADSSGKSEGRKGERSKSDRRPEWNEGLTKLTSANEDIYRLYSRSVEDLAALRFHSDQENGSLWVPAAGVPWYVTPFGRDSLIVALQTMALQPDLVVGTLEFLSQHQASERDDWRDAQPGKILHELRFGELAHLNRIPHTPYYGSADSTPLFLIALHEAWKWTGDQELLERFLPNAQCCLEWIDKYGDLDGDGFQEYQTYSKSGYENMGWKDSPEAIVYPDGSMVKQPKALCELQGYVFDAWMRSAEIFEYLGNRQEASKFQEKALLLQKRFEDKFWCEDIEFYACALDSEKRPVTTIISNVGHCLWSGIIGRKRAETVIKRFFEEDLWTGWGIRTISSRNPAYNPHAYHLGSIWPHDNALIALGFKRYGFSHEAARIARAISEAASYFVGYRLPELYAGIDKSKSGFPVQYQQANVPQAWAAGSVMHLIDSIIGLRADVPHGKLYVDPVLPKWLPDLTLDNMRIGDSMVKLNFHRQGEKTRWDAETISGDILIEQRPWHPWGQEQ